MRLTEFWARMDHHLGAGYARVWADEHRVAALAHRTVATALAEGEACRDVWRAVWAELELPPSER